MITGSKPFNIKHSEKHSLIFNYDSYVKDMTVIPLVPLARLSHIVSNKLVLLLMTAMFQRRCHGQGCFSVVVMAKDDDHATYSTTNYMQRGCFCKVVSYARNLKWFRQEYRRQSHCQQYTRGTNRIG
jgi:hypothetical protein